MAVPDSSFTSTCDRLSGLVDPAQYERLRWSRHEGPMLARLVALAQGAIEQRPDFELIEENAASSQRRFMLKIHGSRIVALVLSLDGNDAVLHVEAVERGKFAVGPDARVSGEFTMVDEAWMMAALERLFAGIVSV
jgi:hypothetical protein